MTLCQFKFLDISQQLELISKNAIPIVERTDGDFCYKLFCVDTFYIEEKWCRLLNKLLSFSPFTSEEKLLPYIHAIDLWQLKFLAHQAEVKHGRSN